MEAFCQGYVLGWAPPEAEPETGIWVQVDSWEMISGNAESEAVWKGKEGSQQRVHFKSAVSVSKWNLMLLWKLEEVGYIQLWVVTPDKDLYASMHVFVNQILWATVKEFNSPALTAYGVWTKWVSVEKYLREKKRRAYSC